MNMRRFRSPLAVTAALVAVVAVAQPVAAEPAWLPAKTIYYGGVAESPAIAVNARGDAAAIWLDSGGVKSARRPSGGVWSTSTITTSASSRGWDSRVALDAKGNAVAAWQHEASGTSRIRAAHRSATGSWSTPVTISGSGSVYEVDLATDKVGNAIAVWAKEVDGGYRVQAARKAAGGGWSAPTTLSAAGQLASRPHVAVDGEGGFFASWLLNDGASTRLQVAYRATGATWSAAQTVSGAGQDVRNASVAAYGAGAALAAWSNFHPDGSIRLSIAERAAGGGWGLASEVTGTGQWADYPDLAVSPHGDAALVWNYLNYASTTVQFARRMGPGSWSAPQLISSGAGRERAEFPQVAVAERGETFATWSTSDDGQPGPAQAAYQRVGFPWTAPAQLSPTALTGAEPQVAADDQGNALTLWHAPGDGNDRVQAKVFDGWGPPTAMAQPSHSRQRSASFPTEWRSVDRWSAIGSGDVRYRVAAWNAEDLGPHVDWKSDVTGGSATFDGKPGNTYCFSARTRDAIGNQGSWSTERCTATPVDDRTLTSTGPWWRASHSEFYEGTYTRSTTKGAKLTLDGVRGRHLSLLASTCSSCGSVKVSLNGTSLGTFSLTSSSITRKALISVKTFSEVQTGTVTIEVVSSTGKPVYLDGLVVKR